MNPSQITYRPDIDGLRAIAVGMVLLCHAGLGVSGGYVGVDVFFVISGYLIVSLILKDLQRGAFSLAAFLERRVRRIVPALVAVTAISLATGWYLSGPDAFASHGKSVVGVVLLMSNVYFWRETGYFEAAASEKPLLHTWSLAVEEQFYLIVPLFLLFFARANRLKLACVLLTTAMVGSFGLSVYGSHHHPWATFYLLPTRMWELAAGALLAFVPQEWGALSNRRRNVAAVIGACLLLAPCFAYDESTRFPGVAALAPVFGTILVLWAGRSRDPIPIVNRCLSWPPLVFVGLISYSLYLWHWPIFAFAKSQSIFPLTIVQSVVLAVASVLAATISWYFVEIPFRHRKVLPSRRAIALATVCAFAGLVSVGVAIAYGRGFDGRMPMQARMFANSSEGGVHKDVDLDVNDVPENLASLGKADAPLKLLIWGDSLAMAVLPAIDSISRKANSRASAATHSATPPVVDYAFAHPHGLGERAIPFNAAVLAHIRDAKIPAVLMVASWNAYLEDAEFGEALLNTIDRVQATGAVVYFMNNVPTYRFDVPKALVLYSMRGRDVNKVSQTIGDYELMNKLVLGLGPELTRRGVTILDPIPVLQARTRSRDLPPFDQGGSFYRDRLHLSIHGAMAIESLFEAIFDK